MEELYRRVDNYSTLEDNIHIATQNVIITSKLAGSSKLKGKKSSKPKEGQSKNRKRSRDQSQKEKEPPQFTPPPPPLNITYERFLPLILDLLDFKWPAPIKTDFSQRNPSVRCDFHRDHEHETNRCQSLKFLVEILIKAGHLRRYVREVDRGAESAPTTEKITVGVVARSESRPVINYIL